MVSGLGNTATLFLTRAERRLYSVGGGGPVNFDRRRRRAVGPKKIGGGGVA